jgi:hypothetical protein
MTDFRQRMRIPLGCSRPAIHRRRSRVVRSGKLPEYAEAYDSDADRLAYKVDFATQ